jgi:hypothetical protein
VIQRGVGEEDWEITNLGASTREHSANGGEGEEKGGDQVNSAGKFRDLKDHTHEFSFV